MFTSLQEAFFEENLVSNAVGLRSRVTWTASALSCSNCTVFLHSLQLQNGEQYDWFLKHSQYNLRHFDFRQLHETPSPEEVLAPWLHTGDWEGKFSEPRWISFLGISGTMPRRAAWAGRVFTVSKVLKNSTREGLGIISFGAPFLGCCICKRKLSIAWSTCAATSTTVDAGAAVLWSNLEANPCSWFSGVSSSDEDPRLSWRRISADSGSAILNNRQWSL